MAIETIIFTFKISVPFKDWAKGFDSSHVETMHKAIQLHLYDFPLGLQQMIPQRNYSLESNKKLHSNNQI